MSRTTSHFLEILTFFFLITLPFPGNSQENEKTILLQLKQFWSNPPSINHWAAGDHCTWPEINCTGTSVTGITLPSKDIAGNIPPFICNLKNLNFFDLQNNSIIGSFPKVLYNCSNLQYLDISQNYFVGIIPYDIDKLSHLYFLNLEANNFTGDIPAAIGRLPELATLKLSSNLFNGSFPPEIGNLSNLQVLELSYNSEFPPWTLPTNLFTNMKKLRHLFITVSNLVGEIPETIGNLTALEILDFSDNKLSGRIPESLFLLKNLTSLFLYTNKLSGSIPQVIEALNLEVLDLSVNNLTGTIPDDIGKLTKLTGLSLFYNNLSGVVPASIAKLPSLVDIKLFSNNLSGELPPDFGQFSMLERFEVATNKFVGSLPDNLCYNGVLIGLAVLENNLKGEIPRSLGNCSSLEIFRVSSNQFSGKIPDGLWISMNLTEMMVSDNFFSGQLPDIITSSLTLLEIQNNNFSGNIPANLSSWKNLGEFVASNNQFNGSIPQELTSLAGLQRLLLDRNLFTGLLPEKLVSWTSLATLDLSGNHISGPIPVQLGSLPKLIELYLSENEFSGQIPPEVGLLRLSSLNLSSNHLSGRIPSQYENAAFSSSFLNNTDLCSNNPSVGINSCNTGPRKSNESSSHGSKTIITVIAVVLFIFGILFSLYVILLYRKRKQGPDLKWKLTSFQRLNFTETTILSRLTEDNVIGSGGSGIVYRVPVNHSGEYVAVKKIKNNKLDKRLENEFNSEVELLSTIRHVNIVKLLCCISSESLKLIVYQHMENGSLDQWLHGNKRLLDPMHHMNLDWPKRMHIAIGAARGLCYLHHECSPPIIHRDVKSSNLLLDSEFNAKLADFGLAKILQKGVSNSVSVVAGSLGYLAPEYAHSTRVNEKIDIYSFGVILLELVTGREANEGGNNMVLVEWAWQHIREGKPIIDALDVDIKEPSYLNEMLSVFKLGIICTGTLPSTRPSMKEVLKILLQSSHSVRKSNTNNGTEIDSSPLLKKL